MDGKQGRLVMRVLRWLLGVLASMLIGALVVGAGGFVLGLVADGVGALDAFFTGALAGALFGVFAAFGGQGLRFLGPQHRLMGPENRDDSRRR